jgi:hypothetical protein
MMTTVVLYARPTDDSLRRPILWIVRLGGTLGCTRVKPEMNSRGQARLGVGCYNVSPLPMCHALYARLPRSVVVGAMPRSALVGGGLGWSICTFPRLGLEGCDQARAVDTRVAGAVGGWKGRVCGV